MSDNRYSLNHAKQNVSCCLQEQFLLYNYNIQKTIGEGTFGKVKLAIHLPTNEQVAIKILEKVRIEDNEELLRITREIKYLKYLNHRNIIQIYEILENSTTFYIIMEYATHGELFTYINEKKRLSENEAAFFYAQIISGIEYIHKNRIAHRDLKPENILITKGNILKLIDFGLSNRYQVGQLLSTACGSPCYAAPEMILGQKYKGLLTDIWSSGIILFAMVCGFLPFEDEHNENIYQKVLSGLNDIPSFLSPGCKDLIKKLLTISPSKRILIEEIKVHLFLQSGFEKYDKLIKTLTESQANSAFISASGAIGRHNEIIIEKMLSMNSFYFYPPAITIEAEEILSNPKEKLKERIDRQMLKNQIDSNKFGSFAMTYNLLLKQYNSNDYKSINHKELNNKTSLKESISNELTSSHSPLNNNNTNDTPISLNTQVDLNHVKIEETQHNKEINDISSSTINDEITDSIDHKINSHLFQNDFNVFKKQQQQNEVITSNNVLNNMLPIKKELLPTPIIIHTTIKINNDDNRLSNSLGREEQKAEPKERVISIEKIIKNKKLDPNIILGKSALNPLHNNKKHHMKYKRNNHINAYLQSVPLSNKINHINDIIANNNSIDNNKGPLYHKTFSSRLKASFAPTNTINLIPCNIQKKNQLPLKQKLLIQTNKPKSNKTMVEDHNDFHTNTITNIIIKSQYCDTKTHKRSNSTKNPDDNVFINGLNDNQSSNNTKEKEMQMVIQSQQNSLRNQPQKKSYKKHHQNNDNQQSLIYSQPYLTNQAKYNTNMMKRTKHLSMIEVDNLLIDNDDNMNHIISNNLNTITSLNTNTSRYAYSNTSGNITNNNHCNINKGYLTSSFQKNISIELTKKPILNQKEQRTERPLFTESTIQLESITEGNYNQKKMIQTSRQNTINHKSPVPMKFGNNKNKINRLNKANISTANSLLNSTHFFTTHLNPKTTIDLGNEQFTTKITESNNSKTNYCQSNKDITNIQNSQRVSSPALIGNKPHKHNSSKGQSKINKPKLIFSPINHKKKEQKIQKPIINSTISLLSMQTHGNSKSKESRIASAGATTTRNVQLDIKATNNDFALCSTKSSLCEIKAKLYNLCKESQYTIREIDAMQYILTSNNDAAISIEISRVEIKNVLKLYHYQGEENETKEMIKTIIINIGF